MSRNRGDWAIGRYPNTPGNRLPFEESCQVVWNASARAKRAREWEALEEATGEASTSGALDVAIRYYLRMAGRNEVEPQGRLIELMQSAEQGSLTAAEIADVLDVDQLPVEYESQWSFGRD